MRIFKDSLEAVKEVERDLFEMGTLVKVESMQDKLGKFETLELRTYCYTIIDSRAKIQDTIDYLNLDKDYLTMENEERTTNHKVNPGNAWRFRKNEWDPYLHNGKFAYTYSERIGNQIKDMIDILNFDSHSRQAIISIYNPSKDNDNRCGVARVPCSMYYQFMIRDGRLCMVYTMRSCDFLRHFGYDLVLGIFMQWEVAKELGCACGDFTHFIGSLHAYKKDMEERGIF